MFEQIIEQIGCRVMGFKAPLRYTIGPISTDIVTYFNAKRVAIRIAENGES